MNPDGAPTVISIPSATAANSTSSSSSAVGKKESSELGGLLLYFLGKSRYKLWVLAAILMLAFWSMFTGSLTLKWSAGHLTHSSDELDFPIGDDLDILEVEEKEKVVRHLWDLYSQGTSGRSRLPRFWQEAFQAAYEALASDVRSVRDAAISEIAKLSICSLKLGPLPLDQPSTRKSINAMYGFLASRRPTKIAMA